MPDESKPEDERRDSVAYMLERDRSFHDPLDRRIFIKN